MVYAILISNYYNTHLNKDQPGQPASTHSPIIILLCELFILRLAGHNTIVDAAPRYCGARASRPIKEFNYQLQTSRSRPILMCHRLPVLPQLLSIRSIFPLSIFVALPATFEENWSLFHRLDQLLRLRVVMNINEKYGLLFIGRITATSHDVVRHDPSCRVEIDG
jgi:hypothetical protein